MIGRTLLHYEIVSALGEGGMGVVYKARDTHLDRLVAIKILSAEAVADPGRKRRFTLEAKAASALNHPGIVTIYDIAEDGGIAFIAMECVQGKTLGDLIGRRGLGLKSALNYAVQAADALAKAHAAGIVHRDLKPSNIMVTDDGRVKILDFGVAKLATWATEDVEEAAAAETRTMRVPDTPGTEAGKIVGTVAYMSPEQAEGKKVDARSDIFSFGSVLYEMVTGTRLFQEATAASTLAAVLTKEPKPPGQITKGLPRDLERIILRCLRKDPARRVQFMADLAVELEEIKTESGTGIGAVAGPASARRARTRPWLFGSTAAALLLAVAGAWFFWPKPAAPLAPTKLLPLTSLPGDERLTTFSPDGKQVAFTWSGEQRDNVDIYIKPIGSESPLRLTDDPAEDTAPAWSPDGNWIALVRRNGDQATIYLATPPIPRSEKRLIDYRPTSVATTVLSSVLLTDQLTTISWFPDSKWLAVAEQDTDGKMNGIVAVPVDGSQPRRLIWEPVSVAIYHFPTVSPTGRFLAYATCKTFEDCVVNVVALAGVEKQGAPALLADHVAGVFGIAWGPGERAVIYGSSYGTLHLERVPVSNGSPEQIELAGSASYPATSQGTELAFTRRVTNYGIWRFDAGGRAGPKLFQGLCSTRGDSAPHFNKDGTQVAFTSNRSGEGPQIFVGYADGTNAHAVTPITGRAQGTPRWSPDGHLIAYDATGEDKIAHIYMVNADGGQPRRLTNVPGTEQIPSWSRDGTLVYFRSNRSGTSEIYRVPFTGGEPVKMTDNESRDRKLDGAAWESWPNGKILYYTSGRAQFAFDRTLFAKTLPDGPETQIVPSVRGWDWFPVEKGIYYVVNPDPRLPAAELRFFDFAKLESTVLNRFEAEGGHGLTVSPNEETVLYSYLKPSASSDLMLIQNYNPDAAAAPTNRWIAALAGAVMVVGVLLVWRFAQGKSEGQK